MCRKTVAGCIAVAVAAVFIRIVTGFAVFGVGYTVAAVGCCAVDFPAFFRAENALKLSVDAVRRAVYKTTVADFAVFGVKYAVAAARSKAVA